MFLLHVYINKITNGISNNIRLFADDTSLFAICDNDIISQTLSLIEDLNTIKKNNWSNTWAVDFNANKTVNVDFTRKNINFPKIQCGYGCEVFSYSLRPTFPV